MDAILDAMPNDLTNGEVAAMLATIASAYSEGEESHAAMHLNTALGMVLSRMIGQSRTVN